MTYRIAESKDLKKLSLLINSAYRGDSSRKGWTTEADMLDGQRIDPKSLSEMLAQPGNILLVIEKGDGLIGSAHLKRNENTTYIGMLTIRPDLQNSGLGKKLLTYAEEWAARKWQTKKIELYVIQLRVELIQWYLRRGYQLTDRTEPFPYGNERIGIPLRRDLHFSVLEKVLD